MKFSIINNSFKYELEKVCRLFMPFEKFVFVTVDSDEDGVLTARYINGDLAELYVSVKVDGQMAERRQSIALSSEDYENTSELVLCTLLHDCLHEITGYKPQWGILTGVRPAKLLSRLYSEMGKEQGMKYLKEKLLVSNSKAMLCDRCLSHEEKIISRSTPQSFSLYVAIPFCPSRCNYCSFVSHSIENAGKLIPEYLELLCKEIEYTAVLAKKANLKLQTIYIGGGTPTTLEAVGLEKLFSKIAECFDLRALEEYTVEAGRPDTITYEKLQTIKNAGVTRISINPQTMNDEVLRSIERKHTAQQTIDAYKLAIDVGFQNINMDLIAGLYGDTIESFSNTLDQILALSPQSITVHSLSMKRSSTLTKANAFFGLEQGKVADGMVKMAYERLTAANILPYYMYRQGKTVGNLENVGYAKPGYEGLYNVYIMDETHTILACGASAVTKLRQPNGNNIERIFNYKYPYEYINEFGTMLDRKNKVSEFYELYSF
ncbi:MAG: coproporphyrinogen dehydrogenase HemZ [Oscillospiraceae bacterium]|nr:coproporphyrinogen dehydrogenase HemZ [Oscillospiraceae bacterium]